MRSQYSQHSKAGNEFGLK